MHSPLRSAPAQAPTCLLQLAAQPVILHSQARPAVPLRLLLLHARRRHHRLLLSCCSRGIGLLPLHSCRQLAQLPERCLALLHQALVRRQSRLCVGCHLLHRCHAPPVVGSARLYGHGIRHRASGGARPGAASSLCLQVEACEEAGPPIRCGPTGMHRAAAQSEAARAHRRAVALPILLLGRLEHLQRGAAAAIVAADRRLGSASRRLPLPCVLQAHAPERAHPPLSRPPSQ